MSSKKELYSLYIYLSDQCNLSCIHCWQSAPLKGNDVYSNLSIEECQPFLADAIAMGLKSVIFSGGEPLLNPDFHKFADYFHDHSISMTMETNGILISEPAILKTIIDNHIYCAISLDGINPLTHNKQRGNAHAYDKTIASLQALDQAGLNYQIIMAISKMNYPELIPLMDWIKENCKLCNVFKINIINDLGRAENLDKKGLLFKGEEIAKISEEVAVLADGQYPFQISLHVDPAFVSFKHLKLQYTCGGHCGYANSLSILANGMISICSLGKQMDKYIFGHVSTVDIKDIWENNPLLSIIHDSPHTHLQGICNNCIFRKKCLGGCRAEALCAYGDFFAPNPVCQYYYDSGKFPKMKLINQNKD